MAHQCRCRGSTCLSPEGPEGGTKLAACASFGEIEKAVAAFRKATHFSRIVSTLVLREYIFGVDSKRNQLETRVATLKLMLVTERALPKPDQREMEKLEKELAVARSALQKYNEEHP
jgi:hypothetical protein